MLVVIIVVWVKVKNVIGLNVNEIFVIEVLGVVDFIK